MATRWLLEQPACILPAALLMSHAWANGNVKEEWVPADKNKGELRGKRTMRKSEDKQCYRARNVITKHFWINIAIAQSQLSPECSKRHFVILIKKKEEVKFRPALL